MQEPEKEKEEKETENKLTVSDIRERILTGGPAAAVGVGDALSARLAVGSGFNIAFLSLRCAALTLLGSPCRHHVTMTEVKRLVERINYAVGLFLVVEAGSGFGGEANACRTAREFERAGADAIVFDDTCWPRENDDNDESEIVSAEDMRSRLGAAREGLRKDKTLLIARTAAGEKGGDARIIPRMQAYREAGADLLGPGRITAEKELIRLKNSVPAPLFGEAGSGPDFYERNLKTEKLRGWQADDILPGSEDQNGAGRAFSGYDLIALSGLLLSARINAGEKLLEDLSSKLRKNFAGAGLVGEADKDA